LGSVNAMGGRAPGPRLAAIQELLFLCTGNICRSPAAEALLRHKLQDAGVDMHVRSAGLLEAGRPASEHGVALLAERGIDASAHRSHTVTTDDLRQAEVIVAMAREHVRETVVQVPEIWPKTFTLKELVRRGGAVGPRSPDQPLADWLHEVHEGRSTAELMGDSLGDDIADPIGQPRAAYERMILELDDLIGEMVWLLWGVAEHRPEPEPISWPA
jgi:protein-tyrosine phosphatase